MEDNLIAFNEVFSDSNLKRHDGNGWPKIYFLESEVDFILAEVAALY